MGNRKTSIVAIWKPISNVTDGETDVRVASIYSAQRQSPARPQIRFQAPLDEAPAQSCDGNLGRGNSGSAGWRLQRDSRDNDVFSVKAMQNDALMQPESRAGYQRILNDGWTDAIGVTHPEGNIWTYWDFRSGGWQRDHGFRIDHLLLSPLAADRLKTVGVDKEHRGREKSSDHTPAWVELDI